MSKKRYRIRKAGPGENPGVQNRTAQFLKKAQNGMEQQAMQDQMMMQQQEAMQYNMQHPKAQDKKLQELVLFIQEESKKETSPVEIIKSLLIGNINPDLIEEAYLMLGATSQEIRPLISQISDSLINEMQAAKAPTQDQEMQQPEQEQGSVAEEEQAPQEEMPEAEPQMSKGGFKKKLLKKAKEGRQLETETPGSILPQPATLNNFIEGVKNEGNKFYANQIADMTYDTPQPNMFEDGGEKGYVDDEGRLVEYNDDYGWKSKLYGRRAQRKEDRQARREARRQGSDKVNYRALARDLGTIGGDFMNSLMPQVFTYRNRDLEDQIENADVDIYFKKKPFGRREWSIHNLDYTSIPGFGSDAILRGSGLDGFSSTYRRERYIPDGYYVGSVIRKKQIDDFNKNNSEINNDNNNEEDDNNEQNLQNTNTTRKWQPGIDYTDDWDIFSSLPEASTLTKEEQYALDMAEKNRIGLENSGMTDEELAAKEAEGMSRKNQLLRYLEQKEREYLKEKEEKIEKGEEWENLPSRSVNLTSNFTEPQEGEMEANEQIVEDYKARQAELARQAAMPWNKWVKSYKDYMENVDAATKDEYGYTNEYRIWNEENWPENLEATFMDQGPRDYRNMSYDDFIEDRKEYAKWFIKENPDFADSGYKVHPDYMHAASLVTPHYAYRQVKMWENASEEDKNRLRRNWEKAKTYTKDQAKYKKEREQREKEAELKKKGSKEAAIRYFARQERMSDSAFSRKYDVIPAGNPKEGRWVMVMKGDTRPIGTGYNMSAYVGFNPYNKKDGGAIELLEGPFGGTVTPELYEYVYGGMEDNPTFAPGGMFKKPKVDPALGYKSPTAEVEAYRKTVYPTSKGIFGQMKDALKEGTGYNALTQGQGVRGLLNTAREIAAPTQFTWLSKQGDPKSAYGYIGARNEQTGQPLANTIVREFDTRMETDIDRSTIGANTDLDYKGRGLFRKPTLTVTDSPVKTKRDEKGNVMDRSYVGFKDYYSGEGSGFLNFDEKQQEEEQQQQQKYGGGLRKFYNAGEIETDYFEDSNTQMKFAGEEEEDDFNLGDCTEEELLDPTTECYKKSITKNKYKVNTARKLNVPLLNRAVGRAADALVDRGTRIDNQKRKMDAFQNTFADNKAKNVSYDVGQGWDAVTGYQSMVDSQFNEPVRVSSARPRGINAFTASKGGQYAVGGVYDLTPQEIDAIMKAGGQIEFL